MLTLIAIISIIDVGSSIAADLSVGVKEGDWIEYNVTYTGSPSQGHEIKWAHMEVTKVEGHIISVSITSRLSDNFTAIHNSTLNLETGDLIDDFIIPANLKAGDTFLDKNLGNVTIERTEERFYAGTTRTVCIASTSTNTYVWDQATGVSVEDNAQETDCSIHTIASDTNMWQHSTESLNLASLALAVGFVLLLFFGIMAALGQK